MSDFVVGSSGGFVANPPGVMPPGVTNGSNAAPGQVGEVLQSQITFANRINVPTSNVALNITSLPLTAGDWDVYGSVQTNPAGTTTTSFLAVGISAGASATLPDASFSVANSAAIPAGLPVGLTASTQHFSLSSPGTVYIVAQIAFAVSTMQASGVIWARRAR